MNQEIQCGKVTKDFLNKKISINGWIKKKRKLGSLIFLDVYDISGIVQVVIENTNKHFITCENLSKESTVNIIGKVIKRTNPNNNIDTGLYEILLEDIFVFSNAKTPPLIIENETDALEEVRLQYRYLDLRRPIMQQNLLIRAKFINALRTFLINNSFNEIETPILSKQTPEGARDFIVPTRLNKFFALPQSPQLYKQLLMIAGFNKYFQIAKCFRDENSRSDRQLEFTQLDIEMSFIDQIKIINIIEKLFINVFQKVLKYKIRPNFLKLDYDECIKKYGTDKPDLRYDYEIADVTNFFKETNFLFFKNAINNGKKINCILIPNEILIRKNIEILEKFAKDNGASGIAYVTLSNNVIEGSIAKNIEKDIIKKIYESNKVKNGTIIFIADNQNISCQALGHIRSYLPKMIKIKFKAKYCFLWVINWPLFELDSKNKITSAHHPFTMPQSNDLKELEANPLNIKAQAYDLVLNGYEIGGGSIRIYDADIQKKIFNILGIEEKEIENKFGFLLNAFKYGVPPHGGIAFGLDRIIMIITNSLSIRDVIAFPKTSTGYDLMLNSPTNIDSEFLDELGITLKK